MKRAFLRILTIALIAITTAPYAEAQGFALDVRGVEADGTQTAVTAYRWTVEEDLTYHVTPGVSDPGTLAVGFHPSYMPVVATGNHTTPLPALDPAKHYFVSVLPTAPGTYGIGGAPIGPGDTSATIYLNALPVPTAQISVLVFKDDFPTNGAPDLPVVNAIGQAGVEQPLEGFKVMIEDAGGRYGASAGLQQQDVFGNNIGTTYQRNPDGSPVLDGDGAPIVVEQGAGFVLSDASGTAIIRNLAPGKYGVIVVPPQGDGWQQTSTIEGTKVIDAWVKANEPPFFTEFGPPGYHVFVGFIQEYTDGTVLAGGETLSGRVTNLHTARPPAVGFFSGAPVAHTTPWIALNRGPLGRGGGIYAAPANDDATFSIPNVPPGDYQLVIFDKALDFIIAFHQITVLPGGGCRTVDGLCDLGDLPVFQWFTRTEHWVFSDDGGGDPANTENGFWDAGEVGMLEQNINLRWRDGTIYQAFPTDIEGFVPFDQTFPFFAWLVAEVDFVRFKATGLTVVVDDGGPIDPADPYSFGGQLNPQPQSENGGLPYRTELGPVLTQGFQGFLGQTSVFMWGKNAYGPDENGGISGIVFYATTRAEDEPVLAAAEPWEPGIPGVTINLYDSTGTMLLNTTTTDSWDDSPPTGCQGDPFVFQGEIKDCFDGLRNFNQVRPAVFDGGYAFDSYFPGGIGSGSAEAPLPAGSYVVEVVVPPGYELLTEESRNVDFGDAFIPSDIGQGLLFTPDDCVGPLHAVPAELTLFPGVSAHNGGTSTPLCSHKRVRLSPGQNAAADFFLYTPVPIAAHAYGFILDDTANEFDPTSPQFGEKLALPWVPISVQDWTGREIRRVYSDEFGVYNLLLPSTYTTNLPAPSGMSPAMYTLCLNSPGTADPTTGEFVPDDFYNPQYSQFCYTFQYMPGATTYLDTPLVPVAAHTSSDLFPVDCEQPTESPRIAEVNGPLGGPYASIGDSITIQSEGLVEVPNPAFGDTTGVEPRTVLRDYGFGTTEGSVRIGHEEVSPALVTWGDASISVTIPAGSDGGHVRVTRGDNGATTETGITLTVGPAGDQPVRVPTDAPTIQAAIDVAAPGDLILVEPGHYAELVIMWKPIRLQGYGPGASVINAVKAPTEKLQLWRDKIRDLINLSAIDLLPGQELLLGGIEPEVFVTEEGPGIMVLGKNASVAQGGYGGGNARIDGFTLTGGDTGGAIFVNGYADDLEISNNRIVGNGGFYGGGIRIGHPFLVSAATGNEYLDGHNNDIRINHNHIAQNGGLGGAGGGISIHHGTDRYRIIDNFICANFTRGNGGGIGHLGLSHDGYIGENTIVFNENFVDFGFPSGGGVFIGGAPPLDLNGLSPGSGDVTIEENLILGNVAQTGDGGGISLARVSGADVGTAGNENDPGSWYRVDVFDNMIVNNVAGLAGGGVSLFDAPRTRIVNNTVANNDSTATSSAAFTTGDPNASAPQPAGLVSYAHSDELASAFGGSSSVDDLRDFSNPRLENNIIWHNRSFSFLADTAAVPPDYTLVPDPSAPVYDDLAVLGFAAGQLDPRNSILTDTSGFHGSNIAADPDFLSEYVNVGRGTAVVLPEPTTGIQAPVAFDEGGNFIRVRYGPLTLTVPSTGAPFGDYHIAPTSPAVDEGRIRGPSELNDDFDGQSRPFGASFDIGADEVHQTTVELLRGFPVVEFMPFTPVAPTDDSIDDADGKDAKKKARKARRKARRQLRRMQNKGLGLGALGDLREIMRRLAEILNGGAR